MAVPAALLRPHCCWLKRWGLKACGSAQCDNCHCHANTGLGRTRGSLLLRAGIKVLFSPSTESPFGFPGAKNGPNSKVVAAADGGTVELYIVYHNSGRQRASEKGWMCGGQAVTHSQMTSGRYRPSRSAQSDGGEGKRGALEVQLP